MQEEKGQNDGEHDTELVYRYHPGSLSHLERLVVADPGGAGGKTGKDQENPAFPADIRETALRVGYEHDGPGHNHYHDSSDRGSQVGVDAFNPCFGEYGRQGGENR